jgi:hypothetical protein
MSDYTAETLCKIYTRIRDKKREVQQRLDKEIAELDKQLDQVGAALKDLVIDMGAQSVKTDYGTAYLTKKTRYYPTDWTGFSAWVVENNAVDLLEKRISKTNMDQWLQECPTNPPIGIHADTEVTITVRKS